MHGDFAVRPIRAAERPTEIGPVDLTIIRVKTYDIDRAVELARPLVGLHTTVLPLQNGVESAPRLSRYSGREAVRGGAVWVVASMAELGVIRQESRFRRIVLGEQEGRTSERAEAVRAALAQSGFAVETTEQIEKVLWTKLLFIASFSGITSVTRAPAGTAPACEESRLLLNQAMHEFLWTCLKVMDSIAP